MAHGGQREEILWEIQLPLAGQIKNVFHSPFKEGIFGEVWERGEGRGKTGVVSFR